MKEPIWSVIKILPTDYTDYGGSIKRWANEEESYPDCSCGCKHFRDILQEDGNVNGDWGVCWNPNSPRYSLLTWEHQAGFLCFESKEFKSHL